MLQNRSFRQLSNPVMRDLQNPKWMYLKAVLFLGIGLISGGLLIAASPALQTVVLLLLAIWSFCRAYYFAFHVIERYVDPTFRFSGLWSLLRYVANTKRQP
jgi:hypothetical protein